MLDVTGIFDKDIYSVSQKEIAIWLMDRKKIHNKNVQIKIGNKVFNTLDCNDANELLSKYKDEFDEIGIPSFVINKITDKENEYYIFDVDNIGGISTLGCENIETFILRNQKKFDSLIPSLKNTIIENFKNLLSITDEKQTETNIELEKKLDNLYKKRKLILRKKSTTDLYKKGLVDLQKNKTPSFEERRRNLNSKIEAQLNLQQESIDVKEAFANAAKQLNEITSKPGRISTEQEINALQLYYSASAFPSSENIVKVLEKTSSLPDSSDIKAPLIDTVLKLNGRYSLNRDEEDLKIVSDAVERLGITSNAINNIIEDLKNELENLNIEQAQRNSQADNMILKLDSQLIEIEEQIKQLTTESDKVKIKTVKKSDLDGNLTKATLDQIYKVEEPTLVEKTSAENTVENNIEYQTTIDMTAPEKPKNKYIDQTDFISKLENITVEGPIFRDTEQASKKESVVETVVKEPTIEPEKIESTIEIPAPEELKNKYVDQTDFIKRLESIANDGPIFHNVEGIKEEKKHFIKQVKTASINLITKIRNFDFNQKVKDVLAKLKEHKAATTIGLASLLVATATLTGSLLHDNANSNKVHAQEIEDNSLDSIENTSLERKIQQNIGLAETVQVAEETVEKTDEEKYHEEIEQALEEVMGGAKVHISVDDAINNQNGKLPTDAQLENSWENSTPRAYYDQDGNNISIEQAINNSANGQDTVVRMDNENGVVGYMNVDQIIRENETGISR